MSNSQREIASWNPSSDFPIPRNRKPEKKRMKKVLLTAVSLLALGTASAVAADLPARTYSKAPAMASPITNWSGFYVGAMGGYAAENTSDVGKLSGGFAGGTLGYNWQTGGLVLGIEADAAWSDVGATVGDPALLAFSDKIRDMGTVRGRIGYAFDQFLIYGTAGYAWADNRLTITAGPASVSESRVLNGWAAGAGVEVMFAPKWSVKAEYLYRSFQGDTYFASTNPPGLPVGTITLNSVQVGVNYHF
jgi:outer membrane immunogenic protein